MKPHVIPDGTGGVIIVSESYTVNPLLRAQRVDRYGNILWDPSLRGIRVSTAGDEQGDPIVVPDGAGGAYVGFCARTIIGYYPEPPEPIYSSRVRIQRLDAHGNLLFGNDGVILYDYPIDSSGLGQGLYSLVPDNIGGVYVMWGDAHGPAGDDVYVNHVSQDGQVSWKNSIATNSRVYVGEDLLTYGDGEGGLIIYRLRSSDKDSDRFIRINRDGEIIADHPIKTGLDSFYLFTAVKGECILFWQDFNQFSRPDTLRCQKINRNGEKLWGERPVIIDSSGLLSIPLAIGMQPDETGGAFLAYQKDAVSTHLVHVNSNGRILFSKSIARFNGLGWSRQPERVMVGTYQNGVLYHFYSPGEGYYACAVDSAGREIWPKVLYSTRTNERQYRFDAVVSDGNGGAIFAWGENVPMRGIWIQQVSAKGELGTVTGIKEPSTTESTPHDFRLLPAYPSPFHQNVHISYHLRQNLRVALKIYDISGKEVITLIEQPQPQGVHEITWDGVDRYGKPVSNGVYFCVLSARTTRQMCKLVLVR